MQYLFSEEEYQKLKEASNFDERLKKETEALRQKIYEDVKKVFQDKIATLQINVDYCISSDSDRQFGGLRSFVSSVYKAIFEEPTDS